MKILLVNDDGYNAPGILSLYDTLSLDHEVYLVAPDKEKSGAGHAISLHSSVDLKKVGENSYAINGSPADCVSFAMRYLFTESIPDLVVSGINKGANLGQDIYYSGTVAAAREATFLKIPSIAISVSIDKYYQKENPIIHYDSGASYLSAILKNKILESITPGKMLNINLPNMSLEKILGVKVTSVGFRHYESNFSKDLKKKNPAFFLGGRYLGHSNQEQSDCMAIDQDYISVTLMDFLGKLYDLDFPRKTIDIPLVSKEVNQRV